MIKPPIEVLSRPVRAKIKETVNNNKQFFDFYMAVTIFLAVLLELFSWYIQGNSRAVIVSNGDYYLTYWYPLLSSLTLVVFASFFLVKVIRYTACVYSKIVSFFYFFVQCANTLFIALNFSNVLYESIIYPVILILINLLLTIKTVRWFISK